MRYIFLNGQFTSFFCNTENIAPNTKNSFFSIKR